MIWTSVVLWVLAAIFAVIAYRRGDGSFERGLRIGTERIDAAGYEQFLVETCADTLEISYRQMNIP